MARTLTQELLDSVPPWLTRRVGGAVMGGIGSMIDLVRQRTAAGVKLRFPTDTPDPDALALIGRERRIRRGPLEDDATYASRLRPWWDDHRSRGGPYAMLRQLYRYWLSSINPAMELIYQSGTRRSMDSDGVITRDAIDGWTGDGSGKWAQTVYLMMHLPDEFPVELVTQDGEQLVTEAGEVLIGTHPTSIILGAMTDDDLEIFRVVPRDWHAAHIPYITIVLFYADTWLVGYPAWTLGPSSGRVLGSIPLVLTTEA